MTPREEAEREVEKELGFRITPEYKGIEARHTLSFVNGGEIPIPSVAYGLDFKVRMYSLAVRLTEEKREMEGDRLKLATALFRPERLSEIEKAEALSLAQQVFMDAAPRQRE
jgi:hypothetical protein